ncbi:hypothetical protein NGM36_25005 [Streptomyces mutabilis]|uniref:hypothetical protein n=1 Tax=Streptomyces mutabilis TaxID=67332 RepID=UPI0022BA1DDC|nr:hypothetical protein [Streptomyces mutabilis]MCZ9352990.1 hypothetical protein [Streptomyces mutabilis]
MDRPKHIEVIRKGSIGHVLVDGVELPFALPREAITVPVHPDHRPTVHLTLFADRVDVVNQLHPDEKETDR